jgi:hypothetical protein
LTQTGGDAGVVVIINGLRCWFDSEDEWDDVDDIRAGGPKHIFLFDRRRFFY